MEQVPWYAEASLVGQGRVYSAGTLAQCVRRWMRLTEVEQNAVHIEFKKPVNGKTRFEKGHIAALAGSPDLKRVCALTTGALSQGRGTQSIIGVSLSSLLVQGVLGLGLPVPLSVRT